jgi:uncharacterized protein YcnI
MSRTTLARLGAVTAAGGLLVLGLAAPSSAHVTVTPDTTAAGGEAILTFSVPHGCDGSATTKVTIQMPKDVIEATPTRNPFYEVTKKTATLAKPIRAADGDEITSKVDTVTYTARTPLPDGYRDAFEIELQVPDDAGQRLSFPTIQQCQKGQTAWTEIPADGQDPETLEHPAPGFVVTAAVGSGATAAVSTAVTASPASATPAGPSTSGGGSSTWGVVGTVVGALGLVVAGVALGRTRRA